MSKSPITVAVFSAFYPPAFLGGGPIRTLSALVKASPSGFKPFVITSDTDLGEVRPLPVARNVWTTHDGVPLYYVTTGKVKHLINAFVATRRLRPDIIYLSSFFNVTFSIIPQVLTALGYFRQCRIAIAPRGEFGAGALGLKSTKKRVFLWLYKRSQLGKRVLWHASSPREAVDIHQALGEQVEVIVRENDTDLPTEARPATPSSREALHAVFVGRMARIKGLHTLLQALKQCSSSITLHVYGPEEDAAYARECKQVAQELPENIQVIFMGATPNEDIRAALTSYDVMTFPTLGENFGHVIAEALAASCPVLCADVTPWTSRILAGGGRIVPENTALGWTSAIEDFAGMSAEERNEASEAAGACFTSWRNGITEEHVFNMLAARRVYARGP